MLKKDENQASNFLEEEITGELEKRILYTGQEQRREAKENYEEKCERKLISSAMKKPRWYKVTVNCKTKASF
jgi:hypothetical protein